MGPTLESATRPKLSLAASSSPPRTAAMPTPIAMMNGTVIGPVVAPPPESYVHGQKAFRHKNRNHRQQAVQRQQQFRKADALQNAHDRQRQKRARVLTAIE